MKLAEGSAAKQAQDAKKLRALELYLGQDGGRQTYASIAQELGVSNRTIQNWFTEDDIAGLINQLVPLWPSLGRARELANQEADRMLQIIVDLADGKVKNARAADRFKAAQYVLALAGVTPASAQALAEHKPVVEEEPPKISPTMSNIVSLYFPTVATDLRKPFETIDSVARPVDEQETHPTRAELASPRLR